MSQTSHEAEPTSVIGVGKLPEEAKEIFIQTQLVKFPHNCLQTEVILFIAYHVSMATGTNLLYITSRCIDSLSETEWRILIRYYLSEMTVVKLVCVRNILICVAWAPSAI